MRRTISISRSAWLSDKSTAAESIAWKNWFFDAGNADHFPAAARFFR